jgi:hypothetical protein
MKKIMIILIFLLLINVTYAQNIDIIREVIPEYTLGDEVNVNIKIFNHNSQDETFIVKERIPPETTLINPDKPNKIELFNGIQAEFFQWQITIPAQKMASVSYTIKPNKVGLYTLTPTKATSSAIYTSSTSEFRVMCIPNNMCSEEENNEYCPEDCSLLVSDGICISEFDSICDPDCDYDPDCNESPSSFKMVYLLIPLAILLIIIIIYILVRILKRNKHPTMQQFSQDNQQDSTQQPTQNDPLKGL